MSSPLLLPLQATVLHKEDLEDPTLAVLNQQITTLVKAINELKGHAGPIQLASHINLNGNRIMQLGAPEGESDAVSQVAADAQFGAEALRPQIEAMGKRVLQTARRINDRTQQENYSSHLNGVLNTAPTTNDSQITFGPVIAGTVSVTISAGSHFRVDGSQVNYAQRTDILTLPTTFNIVSVTRTANEVLVETSAANPFVAGEMVTIAGVLDPSFDGAFTIDAIIDSTHFTYPQTAPDATSTGGSVSLGGVYYYYLQRGTNVLGLTNNVFGSGDSWHNRLISSADGQTIIAVVATNGPSGSDAVNSAAGGTNPILGANVHIFGRL